MTPRCSLHTKETRRELPGWWHAEHFPGSPMPPPSLNHPSMQVFQGLAKPPASRDSKPRKKHLSNKIEVQVSSITQRTPCRAGCLYFGSEHTKTKPTLSGPGMLEAPTVTCRFSALYLNAFRPRQEAPGARLLPRLWSRFPPSLPAAWRKLPPVAGVAIRLRALGSGIVPRPC